MVLSDVDRLRGRRDCTVVDWAKACIWHPFDNWVCEKSDMYLKMCVKYLLGMRSSTEQSLSKNLLKKSSKIALMLAPMQSPLRFLLEIPHVEPCIPPELRIELNGKLKQLSRTCLKLKEP